MAKHSQKSADSITSVLADRILGFLALFIICWISIASYSWRLLEGTNITLFIVLLSLGFILLLAILLNQRLMNKIIALSRFIKLWNVEAKLTGVYSSLHELVRLKKTLIYALLNSLVNQSIFIISVFFTALAVDINVPFAFYPIIIPIITVIVLIPISIGGLGVREGAFVFFFGQQGVPAEASLSLSLLFLGQMLIIAVIGGIIYISGRYRKKQITPEKD